jgi:hypothetical protein
MIAWTPPVHWHRSVSLLAALVLAAGCGGSSANGPTAAATAIPASSQAATSAPTLAPTATPPRKQVGAIEAVLTTTASVNGADAFDQEPLYPNSEVATDPAGSVSFSIAGVIRRCTIIGTSRALVEPSADVAVSFSAGGATCATEKSSVLIQLDAAHDTQLSMTDPLFVVSMTQEATTVQVVQGMVAVRGGGSASTVYLGPALQVDVRDGGGPGSLQPFDRSQLPPTLLTPVEEQLGTAVLPGLGRPDPSGSPVLGEVLGQGRLVIGIDDRVAADPASAAFLDEFRAFQGHHWDIGVDTVPISAREAPAALKEGKIRLFAAPAADAAANLPGLSAIPLFAPVDPPALIDLLTEPDDPVFAAAERSLIQALVGSDNETDNYAALYRHAFAREPDYAPLAGLFGLGR